MDIHPSGREISPPVDIDSSVGSSNLCEFIRWKRRNRDDNIANMDFTTASSLAERGLIYHRPIIYHRKRQTSFPPPLPRQLHISGKTFGRVVASPVCFSSTGGEEGGVGEGVSLDSGTARGGHVTRNNEANNESGLDNAVLEISPRRLPKSFGPFLRRAPYIRPRNFSSPHRLYIRRYI